MEEVMCVGMKVYRCQINSMSEATYQVMTQRKMLVQHVWILRLDQNVKDSLALLIERFERSTSVEDSRQNSSDGYVTAPL